jgi:hypothetical protein
MIEVSLRVGYLHGLFVMNHDLNIPYLKVGSLPSGHGKGWCDCKDGKGRAGAALLLVGF